MGAKKLFNIPYAGIDKNGPYHMLIGERGDCSVIFRMTNPVIRFSADAAGYEEFQRLLINMIGILGDGYIVQKLDIISKVGYNAGSHTEYLQQKYHEHFDGRERFVVETYLTITRPLKKGRLYVKNQQTQKEFLQAIAKVAGIIPGASLLLEPDINYLVLRLLSMDFKNGKVTLDNIAAADDRIRIGKRHVKAICLVNTDNVDLPPEVSPYIELNQNEALRGFPADLMSFLFKVPGFEVIVFNQLLDLPEQVMTLRMLEAKKKKHSGIPDPVNQLCVDDIDRLLADVARDKQPLVRAHYNVLVAAHGEQLTAATNFIENALFQHGIICSDNSYNQLELFRTTLPGNGVEVKTYDWFLTTAAAATCFFFKESLLNDEPSEFLIRFTDRDGIPVGIDPADLPMRTGRINNRNKFVLGPSGSGKSFFMNALIEQYMLYNMDVVIVDTGHSYSGLCKYYEGKYITYTDERPITMNPFRFTRAEFNIEKRDFLCTLIGVCWKGADGTISTVERDVIADVISAYYDQAFLDGRDLGFDTFYEFALALIPGIRSTEKISFDFDEFRYVLKKFYKGGEFARILNEDLDSSLFSERFIVFEIDQLKENKVLFPIVTLVIMDVFIQKMRYRNAMRKALVLEEAWKAVSSPLMAGFLLYLNKTVRKFWGEVVEVTQEVGDVIGNPIIKDSIINNSDTICLLDQSAFIDRYDEIAALLSISDTERKKIFTINQFEKAPGRKFKEVYIRRGTTGEVYGVEVSLAQYLTYTTEKPEKSAVEYYSGRFDSYTAGVDAFISDLKQSGLLLHEFIAKVNARTSLLQ
ncbi:conjugation system TraG family ATPase [Mucilaginibacter sp. SG538B]|uniref:TraG family conjugative transposon ATPase n=1 Tax=Mucilaginibacter sp. SG538B TaxID=2587021 RepID=UPI00159E8B48|nr:TraG family conjugative transposon ATPase [Mucilaginibacter sp. SG538B]NVM66923.1 conjugation system TraG family ATPase [Mucilaginibacter sp. SG538B]